MYLADTSSPDRHGYMRAATLVDALDDALHFSTRAAALRVMVSQPTGWVVRVTMKEATR